MRRLIGLIVLAGGLGGLGYVATSQNAERMQAVIAADAQAVGRSAIHAVQTQVSGRDVRVSGTVNDTAERTRLMRSLEAIEGVRIVDLSGVAMLPQADPFLLRASFGEDGTQTLSGFVPTEAARSDLAAAMTPELAADLTLAAGAPDAAFTDVAIAVIGGLGELVSGEVALSGQTLTITALAADPAALATFEDILQALPQDYSAAAEIDLRDDGTPLRLSLTLQDDRVAGSGKFPTGMPLADITDRFDNTDALDVIEAAIPSADPQWPAMARVGMDALGQLIDGQLMIEGADITLNGSGSPDGVAQARALLDGLPDQYSMRSDVGLWDDGAPLVIEMVWDGDVAEAAGRYPADFTPRGPAGVAVVDEGRNSFVPDDLGSFTANANAGVAALGLMDAGTLTATETTIALTGIAASPQIGLVMDSVLANAGADTVVTRDITYVDDGSPAAWTLRYDATNGAVLEGRLPTSLSVQDIADVIGISAVSGTPATALEDDDAGTAPEALLLIAGYMPEIESLTYSAEGGASAVDLIMSPGVDLDLVAVDLAEQLPGDVAFSIGPLGDLPTRGTRRVNAVTDNDQVFNGGFWLPALDFTANFEACDARTRRALEAGDIAFLSGSARLDATSIRTVNELAAVALPCVESGLTFEVGGHTDATGAVLDNDLLSQDRANAVRQALIERGVPAVAATAFGFGQSQPIADNETAEGRAANRRTDITWFEPGALRDP